MGWLALGLGLAVVLLAARLRERGMRAAALGGAILLAVAGVLHLLSRPAASGRGWTLPGFGPRRWHSPG